MQHDQRCAVLLHLKNTDKMCSKGLKLNSPQAGLDTPEHGIKKNVEGFLSKGSSVFPTP